MKAILIGIENRLAPAENLFFTWLLRLIVAALLVGSAWIDDAPPLELGAMLIALYVVVRVVMQFGTLVAVMPFDNRALKVLFAAIALALLAIAFVTVATLVNTIALSAIDQGID
jgi:hypothetical protein